MASWIHKYKWPVRNTFGIFDKEALILILTSMIKGCNQIALAHSES